MQNRQKMTIGCLLVLAAGASCPFPDPIVPLKRRDDLGELLESLELRRGAELGVLRGDFASLTLSKWPSFTSYLLVDVWKHQEHYKDHNNPNNEKHNTNYQEAMTKLAPHRDKIAVCRNFTTECARTVPDGSLDFIYVDARHDRKGVAKDLEDWWPKLSCGGIFAGHDYVTQDDGPQQGKQDWTLNYDGTRDLTRTVVKGAVDEFSRRVQRQLSITYRETGWNTWMLRK